MDNSMSVMPGLKSQGMLRCGKAAYSSAKPAYQRLFVRRFYAAGFSQGMAAVYQPAAGKTLQPCPFGTARFIAFGHQVFGGGHSQFSEDSGYLLHFANQVKMCLIRL